MPSLRLIAWNCQHGSLTERLSRLAPFSPDLVFLQECQPEATLPLNGTFLKRGCNPKKGIALGALNEAYAVTEIASGGDCGKAMLAADVTGPIALSVLGIWAQGPRYVDDVLQSLKAYEDVLCSGRAVVMGDMNSGPTLNNAGSVSGGHRRLLDAFAERGLVSAYHTFHGVEQGREAHPTYLHRFNPLDPWHIDFCFVPQDWASKIAKVEVLDGEEWRATSDHHPLLVELRFG